MPEAAYVEDAGSDDSSANPRTRIHAIASRGKEAGSDSGYSSQIIARSPLKSNTAQLKPILHRSDSARGSQRSQTVSVPTQRPATACGDPKCHDAHCLSGRNTERRYTIPPKPPIQTQHHHGNDPRGQPNPQAPKPQFTSMGPPPLPVPLQAGPRPQAGPSARPVRPVSVHGYSMPSIHTSFDASIRGPPPASSAYYAYPITSPAQGYYGTTPSTPLSAFPPVSPMMPQPSPSYPGLAATSGSYSARTVNPSIAGLETNAVLPLPPSVGLARAPSVSARMLVPPALKVSQRVDDSAYSDTDSGTDSTSGSDYYEDDHRHRRRSTVSKDHRQLAVRSSSLRRPDMHKSHTTTSVPRRPRSREPRRVEYDTRPKPRSDAGIGYISSSEQFDSDQTARARVGGRGTAPPSRTSRRPSVSTTASSRSTKATTLSSMSDYSKVVVEDKHGRRVTYMSNEEISRRAKQQKLDDELEEQRQLQETIAAYQKDVSGGHPHELTAENIRRQLTRRSDSHVSGTARSQRSTGSKASKTDGIKIQSGDTILHVYGETKIEMRPSEDGGPAHLIIGSATGRNSGYHGSSKSSSSRKGRSHVSRIREGYEEDDYERDRDRDRHR